MIDEATRDGRDVADEAKKASGLDDLDDDKKDDLDDDKKDDLDDDKN